MKSAAEVVSDARAEGVSQRCEKEMEGTDEFEHFRFTSKDGL